MQDKHDEMLTPALREELKMNSIIASLAELSPEERDRQIRKARELIESYQHLMEKDPELRLILSNEKH